MIGDRVRGVREERAGVDPVVRALSDRSRSAIERLGAGAAEALRDYLEAAEQMAAATTCERFLVLAPVVVRRGGPIVRERVLAGLRGLGVDAGTEELAEAAVGHARMAMLRAIRRLRRRFAFQTTAAMLVTLRLHAELALQERLAPFDLEPSHSERVV